MKSVRNQTDATIIEIFSLMARDFKRFSGHKCLDESVFLLKSDIVKFRDFVWPTLGEVDVMQFKAHWQLQNFLKRHRFLNDAFSDDDLEMKSQKGFIATQERLSSHGGMRGFVYPVLQEARRICRGLLGPYDETELMQHCRIGKRATIGSPLHMAYLDSKLGDPKAFTCPTALRSWFFEKYLPEDPRLGSIVARIFRRAKETGEKLPLAVDSLNLVDVPKSWKAFRGITPLSNIGLFYSYGLQQCFTARLNKYGLPIARLQNKHQRYAKASSIDKRHATVDLSEASNSIRSSLLRWLLPCKWYAALAKTFIRQAKLGDKNYYLETVLPMGNAATFPVETLVFYSLIKAVGNLLNVRGIYSVYGDDLVYPCKIHRHVTAVLAECGLNINAEKSFASLSSFRESCGGDFYHGIDVRPCLAPELNAEDLKGKKYLAWLYKLYNGLVRRWSVYEIPSVIRFILGEIAFVNGEIHQVPTSYPDTSGIKTDVFLVDSVLPFLKPRYVFDRCAGAFMISFRHLAETTSNRVVEREEAYLWDWFRSVNSRGLPPVFESNNLTYAWLTKPYVRGYLNYRDLRVQCVEESIPPLFQIYSWKSKCRKDRKTGRLVRHTTYKCDGKTYCTAKVQTSFVDKVSSIEHWAQDSSSEE